MPETDGGGLVLDTEFARGGGYLMPILLESAGSLVLRALLTPSLLEAAGSLVLRASLSSTSALIELTRSEDLVLKSR